VKIIKISVSTSSSRLVVYYCHDARKEILEYLLENEVDEEDGGKKATDYNLIEEELREE